VRAEAAGAVVELHISVAPERRGRGHGKSMLSETLRLVREAYGDQVQVRASVFDHNVSSLKLFKACGFKEVGVVESGGERAVIFELK
jgi:L-amino acid N-acyltransferase YncA